MAILFYTKTFKTHIRRLLKTRGTLREPIENVLKSLLTDPSSIQHSSFRYLGKEINIAPIGRDVYLLWMDEEENKIHLLGIKF